ncbi:MAG: hypothetical protein ACJAU0_001886 [Flavobacteriales bacterium]|jgi:hypothetical protein
MRQIILLSVFCLFLLSVHGQRQARMSIPMQLEVGSNFAKFQNDSSRVFSQNPGLVLSLSTGLGFRVKERFAVSAMAGVLLDGYIFEGGGASYDIYNFISELRFNANYLVRKPNKYGTQWHVGSDFGYTFYDNDSITSDENGVTYETTSSGNRSFFIGPELGVTNSSEKGSMSLLISYVYHFEDQITLQTKMYSNEGSALATAKGDYLTLRFRYMLDVAGHKPFQTPTTPYPGDYTAFKGRETVTKQKFTAKHNKLVLQLWDNATEDGDSISVMVNGEFIAKDLLLSRSKSKLIVKLDEGVNTITIFAHNEGTISPNTASCQIRSGLRKKKFTISTSMKRNEAIEVFF